MAYIYTSKGVIGIGNPRQIRNAINQRISSVVIVACNSLELTSELGKWLERRLRLTELWYVDWCDGNSRYPKRICYYIESTNALSQICHPLLWRLLLCVLEEITKLGKKECSRLSLSEDQWEDLPAMPQQCSDLRLIVMKKAKSRYAISGNFNCIDLDATRKTEYLKTKVGIPVG